MTSLGHLVLRLSQVLRRLGARRAASRATTPRTSTHLHGQLGSGPAHRSRNGRLARYEGLKPGAWTVYNDGMVREPGSAGCPELSPARAAALAARRHDGSSSRRREAQAGIGQRRGGGSGSTSEVHKDAMEGLRPAYPPATPERSRARPLRAPRLPTPTFPAEISRQKWNILISFRILYLCNGCSIKRFLPLQRSGTWCRSMCTTRTFLCYLVAKDKKSQNLT